MYFMHSLSFLAFVYKVLEPTLLKYVSRRSPGVLLPCLQQVRKLAHRLSRSRRGAMNNTAPRLNGVLHKHLVLVNTLV